MIYFDNSATTLQKPETVRQAVDTALRTFGNPGRAAHGPGMAAARAVYSAREEIARMAGVPDPLRVALTSGATESLNLVLQSLITKDDCVITTVLEHTSVLRPLYHIGCPLAFLDCDDEGRLRLEQLPELLTQKTRFVVCTHGSNLLGTVTDAARLREFCDKHSLVLILDAAQTLGSVPVDANMADVLCFTGHKSLFGPMGTGGIAAPRGLPFRLVKTGGSGTDSFAAHQPLVMPDLFEAGTPNAHGLAGMAAGAKFVNETGVAAIRQREEEITARFLDGVLAIPNISLYGPRNAAGRLPVVSLNVDGLSADEAAFRLWENHEIAVRAGIHCAPLAHRRLGTEQSGTVRFSFSWFTTGDEVDAAVCALREIAGGRRPVF